MWKVSFVVMVVRVGKRERERERETEGGNAVATDEAAAATEQIYVSDVECWIYGCTKRT
jgi:hypothetical protein